MSVTPSGRVTLVGFDSSWADNPKAPGAVAAVQLVGGHVLRAEPPRLAGFADALALVRDLHRAGDLTLVAIDQPTIVPNQAGARPVERVIASVMSWSGGGIQPAFRGKPKDALFGDGAPIWRFLAALGFRDDPAAARAGATGGFVLEVFPALALLGFAPRFLDAPKRGPRYNPARPTFSLDAWAEVRAIALREAEALGLAEMAGWCRALDPAVKPRKADQDRVDSVLCLLVAAWWLLRREYCLMIGDTQRGYIVTPNNPALLARLRAAPRAASVAFA